MAHLSSEHADDFIFRRADPANLYKEQTYEDLKDSGIFASNWQLRSKERPPLKIAICTTTADEPDKIKRWMRYHQILGVTHFYLFLEGQATFQSVQKELLRFRHVMVFPQDKKLEYWHNHSHIWHERWLAGFFNKPCNSELFVRQSLNMEVALKQAWADQIDWILHIDTDELLHPASSDDYSIATLLNSLPKTVDLMVFPNYEALPESPNVTDPFTQVNLFKKAYQHLHSDFYFKYYKDVAHGNPNYFITYGNGKSAARMVKGIRPNGAHRWSNYDRRPKEETSNEAAVLHYTYNKFSDLVSRRDRCDCAPTKEEVQRCFFLPFDREAFMASSLMNQTELRQFFLDHLIWRDTTKIEMLQHKGLLTRIYAPITIANAIAKIPDYGLPLREAVDLDDPVDNVLRDMPID